jgi:hypothetical protein
MFRSNLVDFGGWGRVGGVLGWEGYCLRTGSVFLLFASVTMESVFIIVEKFNGSNSRYDIGVVVGYLYLHLNTAFKYPIK